MKIIAKIILYRLSLGYGFWRKIHIFQHGAMEIAQYAHSTFKKHYEMAGCPKNYVCLELGPGDSLNTALIAKEFGAIKTYLIDNGDYATKKMEIYHETRDFLLELGYAIEVDLSNIYNMLESTRATYLIGGLRSLKQMPDNSVDFLFSQAVLEHIRKKELLQTLSELYRLLKPSGVGTHVVDLKDHLAENLHSLRFSEAIWESKLFSSSGFYTNRFRFSEVISMLESIGYEYEVISKRTWDKLPLDRKKLTKQFQDYSDEDLCIYGFTIKTIKKA